ncbi:MAG: hypothetical protein ACYCW6_26115 [Candidatus Xenobia bacterium]
MLSGTYFANPSTYMPGQSILMLPLLALSPHHWHVLQWQNLAFAVLTGLMWGVFVRPWLGTPGALAVAAACWFNAAMLSWSTTLMSEIPFGLTLVVLMLLVERTDPRRHWQQFGVGLMTAASMLVRNEAFVVGLVVVVGLMRRRQIASLLLYGLGCMLPFGAYLLLQRACSGAANPLIAQGFQLVTTSGYLEHLAGAVQPLLECLDECSASGPGGSGAVAVPGRRPPNLAPRGAPLPRGTASLAGRAGHPALYSHLACRHADGGQWAVRVDKTAARDGAHTVGSGRAIGRTGSSAPAV